MGNWLNGNKAAVKVIGWIAGGLAAAALAGMAYAGVLKDIQTLDDWKETTTATIEVLKSDMGEQKTFRAVATEKFRNIEGGIEEIKVLLKERKP